MESNGSDPAEKEIADDADRASKEVSPKSRNYAVKKSQTSLANRNQKKLTNRLEAKWIRVYINGDEHFPGFKCVVNSKYYRNFDAFLSYLTERLRPGFGAVRNIYTPISGHTIGTLEDLRPNEKYVVAGSEKLKRLEPGYSDIGFKSIKKSEQKPAFKRKYSSVRSRPVDQNPVALYFYKNGAARTKPVKMVFQSKDVGNFERIFDKLQYKMQCGHIKRLYSLNGKPINNLNELQNEQSYVVVEKYEVFKSVSYGAHQVKDRQLVRDYQKKLLSAGNSRIPIEISDSEKQSTNVLEQSSENIKPLKSAVSRSIKSEAENEKKSDHNVQGSNKIDLYNFSDQGKDVLRKYEPSATYELSFQVKELDLDVDLGGVYRAREKYYLTEGAREVQDDIETAVEFSPDDLDVEAEEVEDEEEEELTPDMERSMQQLSLDAPDELVAFLPSMQGKPPAAANERTSSDKYNLSQSQTFESQNLIF